MSRTRLRLHVGMVRSQTAVAQAVECQSGRRECARTLGGRDGRGRRVEDGGAEEERAGGRTGKGDVLGRVRLREAELVIFALCAHLSRVPPASALFGHAPFSHSALISLVCYHHQPMPSSFCSIIHPITAYPGIQRSSENSGYKAI